MSATSGKSSSWQAKLMWAAVVVLGAVSFGIVALSRGETVNAAWLVVTSVCVYFVAYRFYGLFVANRAGVDGTRRSGSMCAKVAGQWRKKKEA